MTFLYLLAHLALACAGIVIIGQFRDDQHHERLKDLPSRLLRTSSQAGLVNWIAAEILFNIIGFQVGPAWQLSSGILLIAVLLGLQLGLWRRALSRAANLPHSD